MIPPFSSHSGLSDSPVEHLETVPEGEQNTNCDSQGTLCVPLQPEIESTARGLIRPLTRSHPGHMQCARKMLCCSFLEELCSPEPQISWRQAGRGMLCMSQELCMGQAGDSEEGDRRTGTWGEQGGKS